ncbi:hypothetical protein DEO72_LG5g2306 [Vigna unguiculata]|uniref:Uncharacterized protein n=1 Tax=Vigna unguiculata TaxID=3917 RepID=A0A4D6LZM5_VIGUN|nr:hypothetical protein DEO72_LG5g2306 [Vigna unguiculata]
MTKIDTAASKDANSLCCDAINLTTVALSCEPDLPHASGNHQKRVVEGTSLATRVPLLKIPPEMRAPPWQQSMRMQIEAMR